VDRCRAEIDEAERLLRAGHPDVEGLVLALADWSQELRMIELEKRKPPAGEAGGDEGCGLSSAVVLGLAVGDPAVLKPAVGIGSDEAEVAAGEGVREPEVSLVDGVIFEIPAAQFLEDVGLGADDLVHHGAKSTGETIRPRGMYAKCDSGLSVGVILGVSDGSYHAESPN
jgi:hypothetical protein